MGTPQNGTDYLLYLDQSATPATAYANADWLLLGGQQGLSISGSLETAETTDKDSLGWKESIPTKRSVEVSADHLDEIGDDGRNLADLMWRTRKQRLLRVVYPDATERWGMANCTGFEQSAPSEDVATLSVSFEITGAWAPKP